MPQFVTDDGVRLNFVCAGEGRWPVIYLHWMGGAACRWGGFWQCFRSARYRHIALDFRGHGSSERQPSAFTNERLARDVLHLSDALGLVRFALVGHSFGGKIAMLVAALAPTRVTALVLLGAVGPARVPLDPAVVEPILARSHDPEFVRETFRSWFSVWPRPELAAWVHDFAQTPGWAHRAVCEIALWTDCTEQTRAIATPTLVVAGENDPVYGPSFQRTAVVPILLKPHVITVDCGHGLIFERPEEIARHCEEFLGGSRFSRRRSQD